MTVDDILLKAKALSPAERKELLNELIAVEENKPKRSLFELAGLGKEYWEGVDSDAYLNELRDEWDQPRNTRAH